MNFGNAELKNRQAVGAGRIEARLMPTAVLTVVAGAVEFTTKWSRVVTPSTEFYSNHIRQTIS